MQFDQNWSKEDEHFFHKNCQFESNKPVISENSIPTVPTHRYPFHQYPRTPVPFPSVSPYSGALSISVSIHRCPFHQCLHTPVPFWSVSPYTGALSISVSIHLWASALCTFYNNPAPLNGSMQFHYCTLVTREPEQTTLLFWSAACGVMPQGLHTADRR